MDSSDVPPVDGSQWSEVLSNIERRTAVCLGCGRHDEYDFKPGGDPVRVPMDFGYCPDCAPLAERLAEAVASVEALKTRLRQEVDAHRMTLHEHALPLSDETWQWYLSGIPGLKDQS